MQYDRSSKWLIGHFSESLLWLGGERRPISSCQAVQAEVVLPAKLPDGLFEVHFAGASEPEFHLSEVFVYPDRRALDQIIRDLELVHADRREIPELSAITLRPHGRYRIPNEGLFKSRRGTTEIQAKWTSIELWNVPAADLLARNDPGLIPWVPLCKSRRSAASLLTECKRRIEDLAAPELHEPLLTTTFVYADLRFGSDPALKILGERNVLAETPMIKQLVQEAKREGQRDGERDGAVKRAIEDIVKILESRFGPVASDVLAKLQLVRDQDRLSELFAISLNCKDEKTFIRELT